MGWEGHVARMGQLRNCYRIFIGRDNLEDVDLDGRIILKYIFKKWGVKLWIEFIRFRIESSGGLL
jgi:hypothetical protein